MKRAATHATTGDGLTLCGRRSAVLPTGTHPTCRICRSKLGQKQPLPDPELVAVDNEFRRAWAALCPGSPYPGLLHARRRLLARVTM